MEVLSNGSFSKLILMLLLIVLNGLNIFLKEFGSLNQRKSWIFTFYSIFLKPFDVEWTDTKNFPIDFKQDVPF